ncbi:hypothetical protein FACS1894189_0250 [Planctomycetales bacterium]|nr:hypothetical protein FACS1894189_0250 [Planctomycetales bacterium]
MLLPYIEQTPLYDLFQQVGVFNLPKFYPYDYDVVPMDDVFYNEWLGHNTGDDTSSAGQSRRQTLAAERRGLLDGVSSYRCPSSHGNMTAKTTGFAAGPLNDYVALVVSIQPANANWNPPGLDGTHYWPAQYYNRYTDINGESDTRGSGDQRYGNQATYASPFRLPVLTLFEPPWNWYNYGWQVNGGWGTDRRIAQWEWRDAIEWWADGTSNQLCFGEKHIPSWARNSMSDQAETWDGAWFFSGTSANGWSIARPVWGTPNLLAKGPNDPLRATVDTWADFSDSNGNPLGSSHAGIINFLVGDGTVRSISVDILTDLIVHLTVVNDGNVVAVP